MSDTQLIGYLVGKYYETKINSITDENDEYHRGCYAMMEEIVEYLDANGLLNKEAFP